MKKMDILGYKVVCFLAFFGEGVLLVGFVHAVGSYEV